MIGHSAIASKIDHTLLKPEAGIENIRQLCQESIEYGFYSVCINPGWLKDAYDFLKGSSVKLCTVTGFPLGASSVSSKLHETETSIQDGASEIDMVMNIGFFKDKKYKFVSKPSYERSRLSGRKKVNELKDGLLILLCIFKMFISRK